MDYDPVFSKKSNAELNSCLIKYTEEHEFYARALSELSKREKSEESKVLSQFSRAIFWSRLAAILALPGALFVFWQMFLAVHQFKVEPVSDSKQSFGQPLQNIHPPNKPATSISSLDTSTHSQSGNVAQKTIGL
ncbi:MAG: hypothetical protein WA946_03590 [Nitrospirota bacterium]